MNSQDLAVEGHQVTFTHRGKEKSAVLDGLDIHVQKATIYGLLGPSGCGKTTLLRCILGIIKPQSGVIRIYGRKPGEHGFCIPGRGVGYMPQELALYLEFTVEETLQYFGQLFHMSSCQITERILFLTELFKLPSKTSLIKNLSGGQKRRVSFAAALIHKPPLLIMDEPTVGVDPILRQNIWNYLKVLAATEHITIIITTHYVEEARLAHTVGLMRNGRLLAEKNPEELIEQHGLQTLEEVFLKLSTEEELQSLTTTSTETLTTILTKSVSNSYRSLSVSLEGNMQNYTNNGDNTNSCLTSEFNYLAANNQQRTVPSSGKNVHMLMNGKDTTLAGWKRSLLRIRTLMSKSLIQLKRNIPMTLFQLLLPVIQIMLFCTFIGHDPVDLSLAVVNLDTENQFSQKLLENIDNKTIKQVPYSNLSLAIDSVRSGHNWGALYIGPDFTTGLLERFLEGSEVQNETLLKSTIKLYLDMTNQQITFTIQKVIADSFQDFSKDLLRNTQQNPLVAEHPIMLEDPIYGNKDTSFTEFMAPNILMSINYFIAIALTAVAIVIEKKEGLLERSMVAGVNCSEIIFTIVLGSFVIMVIQVSIVIATIIPLFHLPIHGSVTWVFVCVLMAGACGLSLGLFISAICDSENTAVMLTMSTYTPIFLLCGIIWPIEAMPHYLRYVSYCLPVTLLGETIRSVMSRGWSVHEHYIWVGLLISLGWVLMLIILAGIIFRRNNYIN